MECSASYFQARRLPACLLRVFAFLLLPSLACAQPLSADWPATPDARLSAVASSTLAGLSAVADVSADAIEVRDQTGAIQTTITRDQIAALLPWANLTAASNDGPAALAFTDSARLLFIAIRTDSTPPDGLPNDAVLRFDVQTAALTLFTRLDLGDVSAPRCALAHFKGRLYLAFGGQIRTFRALTNDLTGASLATATLGAPGADMSLAIDRQTPLLFASRGTSIARATIAASTTLTFAGVGSVPGLRAIAWSDQFGAAANAGLYAAVDPGAAPPAPVLQFISIARARGQQAFAFTNYFTSSINPQSLAATADGALLIAPDAAGAAAAPVIVRDTSDTRLTFDAWKASEFANVVSFARSLTLPSGWVIDADVQQGWTRFHPATPDAAAWTVLLLLMNDALNADAQAQPDVRRILTRYAGLATDGIAPSRTADGIYRHWLDPLTGGLKPGWDPEFSTMSTMLIVLASSRAAAHYPDDADIRAAASAIACNIRNWDSYFSASNQLYLKARANGGPDLATASGPYNEGIIFTEAAAAYGGAPSSAAYARWLNRTGLPAAISVVGQPVTGDVSGQFQSCFVSLYSLLTQPDFRNSAPWQSQIRALRISHAAWTDDNAPIWNTAFSAGTTRSDWGGYNADSLTDHPGNVATFTSLMAFAAGDGASGGRSTEAVGAYNAYRRGARQTFLSGASILYRRSSVDPTYQPNSAGLPDVALGALGLAELIQPGSVQTVLVGTYRSCTSLNCPADFNADGTLNADDLGDFITAYFDGLPTADYNADGVINADDLADYITAYFTGC